MKKVILCLLFLFLAGPLFAETILLKSGKTVEGKILDRSSEYIKLDFYGTTLTYFLDEIDSIDGKKIGISTGETQPITQGIPSLTKEEIDILEKIKAANKDVMRYHQDTTNEMDIKGFMHSKAQSASDMDIENKIMHIQTQIKEYDINFADYFKTIFEKQIQKAKDDGEPEEKIQKMQESLDATVPQMQQMMEKMIDKIKNTKIESYMADNMQYSYMNGRWIQMLLPQSEKFWLMLKKAREGSVDRELFKQFAEGLPDNSKESFKAFLNRSGTGQYGGFYDVNSISEGDFLGSPCYILDIRLKDITDFMNEVSSAYQKSKGQEDISSSVDSFSYMDFIDKGTFLKSGSRLKLEMFITSKQPPSMTMKSVMKSDIAFSYSQDKINLPDELSNAVFVKDKEELKKILAEDFKQNFKDVMPEGKDSASGKEDVKQ